MSVRVAAVTNADRGPDRTKCVDSTQCCLSQRGGYALDVCLSLSLELYLGYHTTPRGIPVKQDKDLVALAADSCMGVGLSIPRDSAALFGCCEACNSASPHERPGRKLSL